MNLDDLINRAIEVAQSSAASRRDAAMGVAKLDADTRLAVVDKQVASARESDDVRLRSAAMEADAKRYGADASMYGADRQLEGYGLTARANVYSADRNLLGKAIDADARLEQGQRVAAAAPITRAMSNAYSSLPALSANATPEERTLYDQKKAGVTAQVSELAKDPTYQALLEKRSSTDNLGTALRGLSSNGVGLDSVARPTMKSSAPAPAPAFEVGKNRFAAPSPAVDLPTRRTPAASIGGTPGYEQSPGVTSPIRRDKLMDPTRLGASW